jgi:D-arabinose 1-dehydrogenase-like Zn-dependent alcohol dehydrogenase
MYDKTANGSRRKLQLDTGVEPMSLKDKTIVVTGGSRGLGLGLVEALVAQGARVTVVARNSDALRLALQL